VWSCNIDDHWPFGMVWFYFPPFLRYKALNYYFCPSKIATHLVLDIISWQMIKFSQRIYQCVKWYVTFKLVLSNSSLKNPTLVNYCKHLNFLQKITQKKMKLWFRINIAKFSISFLVWGQYVITLLMFRITFNNFLETTINKCKIYLGMFITYPT
jgi:hypothetical protein